MQAGSRIEIDENKEHPMDFALWKGARPGEPSWESPWGPGRPGWHIECTSMSMTYLGESLDIHGGGQDLVFPHHENEIAQSEGATGRPFVRHWVHSAHLVVEGEKMSKSRGNFYTLRDLLERGWDPLAVRYLLLSVHYRKQLNFSFQGMTQAQSALQRVNDFIQRLREIPDDREENRELTEAAAQAGRNFESSLDDDLNTSAALASIFELVRKGNLLLQQNLVGGPDRDAILSFFSKANRIFETFQLETLELEDDEIARLIQERTKARQTRDYARADQIRSLLSEKGIVLEDTREGTRWKRAT
jgi:cysteinyl-tRNA synthetase